MLMIVFGAGASYDSFAQQLPTGVRDLNALGGHLRLIEDNRLPLAAGLFDQRFANSFPDYRICAGLFPQLAWATNTTRGVEAFLEDLSKQGAEDPVVRQQLVALRFYLARILGETARRWLNDTTHGTTNYAVLLDRIDKWRRRSGEHVALVTFNYDDLLETAAAMVLPYFANGFLSMEAFTSQAEYKILKLHGSTSWFRLLPGIKYQNDEYQDALSRAAEGELDLDDTFMTINQKPQ